MALQSKTAITQVYPHQNPTFAAAVAQLAGYDELAVNNVSQAMPLDAYQTRVTTGHAASVGTLPAGEFPGQRKVITLQALGSAGQTFALTPGAGVTWKQADGATACASVTFDAANEYLLVEWNGARWTNVSTNATVA